MNKMRNWMIGLTVVSLLAVGVVAVAGNGFGNGASNWTQRPTASGSCAAQERDADGDGIPNSEDPDWVAPLDGSGYGEGHGRNLPASRSLDGARYGIRQGRGQGQRGCSRGCDGSCS